MGANSTERQGRGLKTRRQVEALTMRLAILEAKAERLEDALRRPRYFGRYEHMPLIVMRQHLGIESQIAARLAAHHLAPLVLKIGRRRA
jgi:hypothetical protein